jgi:hypothetical protein
VPEVLCPIVRDWWERQGRPEAGLIFAVRRGATAGEERKQTSFADGLRRDLRRAFGLDQPRLLPVLRLYANDETRTDARIAWLRDARPMTERELRVSAWPMPKLPWRMRIRMANRAVLPSAEGRT